MSISEKDILASITAKSDQLNACDLIGGPITVQVVGVSKGAADQPVIVNIGPERQPYKPSKTFRRVLVDCWGANPNAWVGRRMTLYCDPKIKWAGEEVGGISISHMSDIDKERRVLVNVTKGKKGAIIIKPLAAPDLASRVEKFVSAIGSCKDTKSLDACIKQGAKLYDSLDAVQRDKIDLAIEIRQSDLSHESQPE